MDCFNNTRSVSVFIFFIFFFICHRKLNKKTKTKNRKRIEDSTRSPPRKRSKVVRCTNIKDLEISEDDVGDEEQPPAQPG